MAGKLTKTLLLVAALSLVLVAPASAQAEDLRPCRGIGQVTGIGVSDFSIGTRQGGTYTLTVDEETSFEDRQGNHPSLAEMQVGGWVAGTCERDAEGQLHARRVILLEGEPPRPAMRAAGEITAVDAEASTFSLRSRQGTDLTFCVTERTRFRSLGGAIGGLVDLQVAMRAFVLAVEGNDGCLEAIMVAARAADARPGRPVVNVRAVGRISDVGGGSFALVTRRGESVAFTVDGSTVFRSLDGSVSGLGDLRSGMIAVVGAREQGDGSLLAVWVGVSRAPAESGSGSGPS
jgi:hypothetical protein